MQQTSTAAPSASFRNNGGRWLGLRPSKEDLLLKNSVDLTQLCRVLIVDRDSMGSDLLADALVRDGGCEASAVQAGDLLHVLSAREADLVVIGSEVTSKVGNGFDLSYSVGRAHPEIAIVLLLNQTTHDSVIGAFRSGARGVFSRQQPMAEFLDCVEHVRKGFIWAGKQETVFLLEAFRSIPAPSLVTSSDSPTLTARELQVVQCAAKGMTNRTIANELGLSEHTVKNYLFRAFEKLGVSSRVELLFYLTVRGHTFSPTRASSLDVEVGET